MRAILVLTAALAGCASGSSDLVEAPAGPPGDMGPTGPAGPPGPAGPVGAPATVWVDAAGVEVGVGSVTFEGQTVTATVAHWDADGNLWKVDAEDPTPKAWVVRSALSFSEPDCQGEAYVHDDSGGDGRLPPPRYVVQLEAAGVYITRYDDQAVGGRVLVTVESALQADGECINSPQPADLFAWPLAELLQVTPPGVTWVAPLRPRSPAAGE